MAGAQPGGAATLHAMYRKARSKAHTGRSNRDQAPKDDRPAGKVPIVLLKRKVNEPHGKNINKLLTGRNRLIQHHNELAGPLKGYQKQGKS